MAAYFARGTGHDEYAVYSERSDVWLENMERLHRKLETAKKMLPAPIVEYDDSKTVGLITFGTNDPAVQEARDRLEANGTPTNYLRVRALPLPDEVTDFINNHDRVYVIENNYDGQLNQIIRIEHAQDLQHVHSLALGDGLPMTAHWIVEKITAEEV
jgi:2-oxoglutarate ferredoxin oxidoreductase subunit alpha